MQPKAMVEKILEWFHRATRNFEYSGFFVISTPVA